MTALNPNDTLTITLTRKEWQDIVVCIRMSDHYLNRAATSVGLTAEEANTVTFDLVPNIKRVMPYAGRLTGPEGRTVVTPAPTDGDSAIPSEGA